MAVGHYMQVLKRQKNTHTQIAAVKICLSLSELHIQARSHILLRCPLRLAQEHVAPEETKV